MGVARAARGESGYINVNNAKQFTALMPNVRQKLYTLTLICAVTDHIIVGVNHGAGLARPTVTHPRYHGTLFTQFAARHNGCQQLALRLTYR